MTAMVMSKTHYNAVLLIFPSEWKKDGKSHAVGLG